MCEICMQTPCHPRCPNAHDPVMGYCEKCHSPLYQSCAYCEDDCGLKFCSEECAITHYGIHEKFWEE